MKTSQIIRLLVFGFLAQQVCLADLPMGKVIWWGTGGMEFDRQISYYEHTNGVIESRHQILTNVVALCPNGEMILRSDGTPFQLGYLNDLPPPGMHNAVVFSTDVPEDLSNVVSVALEGQSYWAIKRDGTVTQWGNDEDQDKIVAALRDVKAIAWAGYSNFLALKNDGTLLGFRLSADKTHTPPTEPAIRPVKVDGQVLSNVIALASMGVSPVVLKGDGTVSALGSQTPGLLPRQPRYRITGSAYNFELGGEYSQTPYQYTSADPVMVGAKALTHVVAIATSMSHSLALKDDGTVVSFDENAGNVAPVPAGLSNVVAIAVDEAFSLALKRDGTVAAWGDNSSNQTTVPAGLSNVVAIATGIGNSRVAMAITTGNVPSSVHIQPHGRLEEMAEVSDLIFKGQVLSTGPITNPGIAFAGMRVNETKLKLISVLKGNPASNILEFQHFATPFNGGWGGPVGPPPHFQLQAGRCYLIFAGSMDKPGVGYDPLPNINHPPNEFREIDGQDFYDEAVTPTLDARQLDGLTLKEAYWLELNLLLNDVNPTNALYAIDRLDSMSLASGGDDQWHSDVFKRADVLKAFLPLITATNEQVATGAIRCFATDSAGASQLGPFAEALVGVANSSPSALARVGAINALSGLKSDAVSNSLASLLTNSDENIRLSAVKLLPRFPLKFAERALRERANDDSPSVRLMVAEVIGDGKYARDLPVLAKLFTDSSGPVLLKEALPMKPLQTYPLSNAGNVRSSAGRALVKFDPDQVSDILKTNLSDPAFHVAFISKLAEKDATPWLPELVSILESRVKYVDEVSKSPADDPRRTEAYSGWLLPGAYDYCWEDIRHYLSSLPIEKLSISDTARYMDLLERTIRENPEMDGHEVNALYELYRTKGLEKRAAGIRQKYTGHEMWFDDFDTHHPKLSPAGSP